VTCVRAIASSRPQAWVAERLRGSSLLVPDSGHYPHVQQPEPVAQAIIEFLAQVPANA